MSIHQPLSTAAIKSLFSEEIAHLGGTVVNSFDDGARTATVFARLLDLADRDVMHILAIASN